MTERTKQLLAEILELPPTERAALLAEVASSLAPDEAPFDPEWLAEIERRAHEARADRAGSTLEQIRARLAERFPRQ